MNRFSKICDILTRKKIEDNWFGETPLKRCLTTLDLTSLGVAAVVAGLYVVTGELARDVAGPAVVVSFFIAGVAALFSGICYAEFGCRIPRAGSAYVYVLLRDCWRVLGIFCGLEHDFGIYNRGRKLGTNVQ